MISNENQWIVAASEALLKKDVEELEYLRSLAADWSQDSETHTAQQTMIDAMIEACDW